MQRIWIEKNLADNTYKVHCEHSDCVHNCSISGTTQVKYFGLCTLKEPELDWFPKKPCFDHHWFESKDPRVDDCVIVPHITCVDKQKRIVGVHGDFSNQAPGDLNDLQKEVWKWFEGSGLCHSDNIQADKFCCALGLAEEAGEVAHMVRCDFQNIREGLDKGKVKEEVADGVADIIIFAMNLCSLYKIKIGDALDKTAAHVLKRDWKKNPKDANEVAKNG